MYQLKRLVPQFDITVPKCMYELNILSLDPSTMENIACDLESQNESHGFLNLTNNKVRPTSTASAVTTCPLDLDKLGLQIQQIIKVSSSEVQNVALRQEKVMQQLNDLKAQLDGIRSTLGLCSKNNQHTKSILISNKGGQKEEPVPDLVINAHPDFIPYALLAVKNAWKDLFILHVQTFTHSTMSDIGKEAKAFENALKILNNKTNLPKINITLIWKNCEHTEMISSPTMYVPIYGEINVIRYLARVGPNEYRYEGSVLCNEIDAVLDICYQLLRCTTVKSKANMIRILNDRLQNQKFFGGNQMSIADIGVHSSLRRIHYINDKDLTPALTQWRKNVEVLTLI